MVKRKLPKSLVFATSNQHKVMEVKAIMQQYQMSWIPRILSLKEIGCHEEIPENSSTIAGNAIAKAQYVFEHYGLDCIAEDTGLEVDALQMEPGVYTARYAGPERDADANMDMLLRNLRGKEDRSAQFHTVVGLIIDGKTHTFEGIVKGVILTEKRGTDGFGYDPIFQPSGYLQSFSEMTSIKKNQISHRYQAIQKMVRFLYELASG